MTEFSALDRKESECDAMDPRIRSIQPGGGFVFRLEYAWGFVRRWCLNYFFPTYVRRMRDCRLGEPGDVPHEIIDPRDLKLIRNQTSCTWAPGDDPFRWRDRLPFVRAGLAEWMFFSILFWGLAAFLGWCGCTPGMHLGWKSLFLFLAMGSAIAALGTAWFFRNPRRVAPREPGTIVAPADGTVVSIEHIQHDDLGGSALEIGIFLSVFNVHVNRMPDHARIVRLDYCPGKFLNALRPESARENEQMVVHMVQSEPPHGRMLVRQIAGAIARRIVCQVRPGDNLARGEPFGMIKLGSRTVLAIAADEGWQLNVQVGDKVQAGTTVLARLVGATESRSVD